MGTSVEGIIVPAKTFERLVEQAHRFAASVSATSLILTVSATSVGAEEAAWMELGDAEQRSLNLDRDLARVLSSALSMRTIWVSASDLTGENRFAVFDGGREVAQGDGISRGLARLFPRANVRDADDLFELAYGEKTDCRAFELRRDDQLLPSPVPWTPPVVPRGKTPLLDREFSWGRPFRAFFRSLAWLLGVAVALLILGVIGAYLWEMMR